MVNAANIIKDWEWISVENENIEAELEDVSSQTALLAIQGPRSLETMQSLTDIELHAIYPSTGWSKELLLAFLMSLLLQQAILVLVESKSSSPIQ